MNLFNKILLTVVLIIFSLGAFYMFVGSSSAIYGPDRLLVFFTIMWLLITLFLPLILSHFYKSGKGLLLGAGISLIMNIIFYAAYTSRSEGFAFGLNVILGAISLIYLVIGWVAYKKAQTSVQKSR